MTDGARPAGPSRGLLSAHGPWVTVVLLVALLPSVGTLGAPLISDDAAALAYVHREGPWADGLQPQYGMGLIRFWRPLVTASLGLQETISGLAPLPLRSFNLAGHAIAALLVGLLALRLGGGRSGALAAGLLAATFPDQGGTVTWIVGRVDSLAVPLVFAALWLALDRGPGWGRRAPAALAAFLACATKEVAFTVPVLGALLAWGRGGTRPQILRAALPLALGAGLAFVLRRWALGLWVGGYPPADLGPAALVRALGPLLPTLGPLVVVGGLALALGRRPRGAWRAAAAGVALSLVALAPLLPLLADGVLEEQNRRWLMLADLGLALALGAGLGGAGHRLWMALGLVVLLAGWRGIEAGRDTREWAAAGELAAAHVARTRATLEAVPAGPDPVFDATLPRLYRGAYCLNLGAADRFRVPFPATPRPVWPLRVLFAEDPPGSRERRYVHRPERDLVWAFGAGQRMVPELTVSVGGRTDFGPLTLDEGVARPEDGGPVLELWGSYPGRFEFLIYTELGYEAAPWTDAQGGVLEPHPLGPESHLAPVQRISLGDVLRLQSIASLSAALVQAADAGARVAYLEVRAVDDAKGIPNRPLAASPMIRLEWDADLLRRLGLGP